MTPLSYADASAMAQDNSAFIHHIVGQMQSSRRSVLAYLLQDQRRGPVRDDIDPELVLQMFDILGNGITKRGASNGTNSASREKLSKVYGETGVEVYSGLLVKTQI